MRQAPVVITLIILEFSTLAGASATLPSPRDATLKTATQIKFGQSVKISMPDSACILQYYPNLTKMKKYCHEGYATASVSGIAFADMLGSGSAVGGGCSLCDYGKGLELLSYVRRWIEFLYNLL